ncbi:MULTISPECIES: RHS repeat-associated core domain-containing protein [unclassified Streptomyces]|uniref:RHS repeat-associated core domain-containing protein n=1 Tax=unclassified Streptomyces TaxID=2593676 RepID=UPI0020364810|nr:MULTISPECIES: RHS repeat-associated core domain-containing protein [unclassified Streptomyces]
MSRRMPGRLVAATALGVVIALAGSTVQAVPVADKGFEGRAVQDFGDPVSGSPAKAAPRPADKAKKTAVTRLDKASWPGPGSAQVAVTAENPAKVKVGGLPVAVQAIPARTARTAASTATPATVDVDVLPSERANQLGAGAVLRVQRGDGSGTDAKVRLSVDYSAFQEAYGGSYGARLRLVELPACASVAKPGSRACPSTGTPLATVNDPRTNTASADVTAAAAEPEGLSTRAVQGGSLVALVAGNSSSQGTYGSTPLAPSASWSVAQSTGGFTWSYPLRVVPTPGGLTPTVGLSYSSQSIDGRTATTNNQGSWIGEGFGYEADYIERSYKSCVDDGHDLSAEQCWAFDNATVMLKGNASQIIKDDDSGKWRLANSDGSKVEKLTGATNGDNDGEHWKITTTDGTEYYFGLNQLPGWAAGNEETASTWTTPVFGDDSGEPCYNATFTKAFCKQAWRWNLDYVKDSHGNVMSHFYEKEVNHYALNAKTDVNGTSYDRGGYLKRIDYGQRDGQVYAAKAPARVTFDTTERCLPTDTFDCAPSKRTKANAARWPDTPVDQECKAATKCGSDQIAASFFTTKRLQAVVTQMRKDATSYQDVDAWSFTHLFLDNGDDSKALWLSKIDHEGRVGTTASLPSLDLIGTQLANRVDATGDNLAPFHRYRLTTVLSETGAQLEINFAPADCKAGSLPKPGESTKRCYPVKWAAPGHIEPIDDWFHKYVVAEIVELDRTGGGDKMVTRYNYEGPAAWRHSKPDGITPEKFLTWGEWQGYNQVKVTSGSGEVQRTRIDYRYFQGMDGDRKPGGGTRSATLTDSTGATFTDDEDYTGFELEAITYNNGKVAAKVINTPWKHHTATQTKSWATTHSTLVKPEITRGFTALGAGGWRETKTRTGYDTATATGRVTEVDDSGWVVPADASAADKAAAAKDDTCTRTWYADNTTGDANLLSLIKRVEKVSVNCGATPKRATQVILDDRTLYDSLAYGAAPTRGLVSSTERLASHNGTTAVYQEMSKNAYDAFGRVKTTTTPGAGRTTTTYTETNGLTTSVKGTNQLDHSVITDYAPAWGQSRGQTDPNGKRSDVAFDGLGRVISVWLPDRVKATQTPSSTHSYVVSKDAPLAIKSQKIDNSGGYAVEYTLYDSLMRARQKQADGPDGTRLMADTFYDSRGNLKTSYETYTAAGAPSARLLEVRNGEVGAQTHYEYDDMGRTTAEIFSVSGVEQWRTSTRHDGDREHVTAPKGGLATTSIRDAQGMLTELRQYPGNAPVLAGPPTYSWTSYGYTSAGALETVKDSAGNTWSAGYDQRGRKVTSVDPDSGTVSMTYDEADRMISTTHEATKETVSTSYDAIGRVTITYNGTKADGKKLTEQRYDRPGMVGQPYASLRYTSSTEYFASVIQSADDFYRPVKTSYVVPASQGGLAGTYDFTSVYNRDGTPQSTGLPAAGGLPAEVLTYGYDEMQRPVTMAGTSTYVTNSIWSPTSQLLHMQLGTGGKKVHQTFDYETGTQRLTRSVVDVIGSTTGPAKDANYSYDQAGNVLAISDVAVPAQPDVQCFRYDGNRRLSEVWTPGATSATAQGAGTTDTKDPVSGSAPSACAANPGSGPLGGPSPYWKSFTTDSMGNRTQDVVHDIGLDASKDVTRTFTYGTDGAGPHAVTKVVEKTPTGNHETSYGYDAAGRMDTRTDGGNTHALDWDSNGKLRKFTSPDDPTTGGTNEAAETSYLYDADGSRVQRKDAEGTTVYLPGMELHLPAGSTKSEATRYYTYADQTVAVRTSDNKVSFLASDHHDTGQLAIDAVTGGVTTRRSDPYGNPRGDLPADGAWPGERGFVGGTIDDSTGLTNVGAREYDPLLGKFISPDPVIDFLNPQQMNAYAYANNSPVTLSDPSGLLFCMGLMCGALGDKFGDDDGKEEKQAQQEVNQAKSNVKATDNVVTQVADEIIYQIKDIVGINALQDCASNPTVGKCLKAAGEIAMNFVGGAVLKGIFKAKRIAKALDLIPDLYRAINKIKKAEDKLDKAEDKLDKAKDRAQARKKRKKKDDDDECETHSFLPRTTVLLADGSNKPIEDVRLGDKVMTTDPETGRETTRAVVGTIVTESDKDFVDLTVSTGEGARTSALISTVTHPFWVASESRWVEAGELRPGMELSTPSDEKVTLLASRYFEQRQRTHDLTIDGIHAYYVNAGDTPLLVHNCLVTVYHYTNKSGYNGIRAGNPYKIKPGDSKNGAGPFFTTRSPADLTAPGAFKKLGITNEKSQYVMELQVPQSALVPLRGDRGKFIFAIPAGVTVARARVRYFGPTTGWKAP